MRTACSGPKDGRTEQYSFVLHWDVARQSKDVCVGGEVGWTSGVIAEFVADGHYNIDLTSGFRRAEIIGRAESDALPWAFLGEVLPTSPPLQMRDISPRIPELRGNMPAARHSKAGLSTCARGKHACNFLGNKSDDEHACA